MIVQCGQCTTKFRLDDAKVKEKGVKVRCSKCRHVFTVFREVPQDDTDFDSMLNGLSVPAGVQAVSLPKPDIQDMTAEMPNEPAAAPAVTAPVEQFADEDKDFALPDGSSDRVEGFDFAVEATTGIASPEESPVWGSATEFNFSEAVENEEPERVPGAEAFGADEIYPATEDKTAVPEFDFQDAPEEPERSDAATAGDGFAEPEEDDTFFLKIGDADDKIVSGNDSPFPLVDEGPVTVAPETFAAAGIAQEQKETDEFVIRPETSSEPQVPAAPDELPPLPISSRRRSATTLPVIVTAISIVFVVILAGAGFYFLSEGPQALKKMGLGSLAEWVGLEQPDEGKMSVRATSGAFIANKEAGELFVVTGEVINGYRKPRASVQVRGLIYGPKGEVLVRKTAYCGNMLSKDQLATMPLSKIEAAMNNQFGDSLSNLGVASGKGIPFVLVFSQLPKNSSDYGVEVAGSTVASQ